MVNCDLGNKEVHGTNIHPFTDGNVITIISSVIGLLCSRHCAEQAFLLYSLMLFYSFLCIIISLLQNNNKMKTITTTSNNTQPVVSLYNVSFVSSFNSLEDFFL